MRMPLFRGIKRLGVIISCLFLSSLLLAACDNQTPNVLNPQGPVANSEAGLFWFILIVATIVFVAVEGVLIYSIIRFRERPNSPAPRQTHGNNTIEIVWTVVPSIFLLAVLVGTIYTMYGLQQPKTPADLTVRAVAHQWWWEFDYENLHVVTADDLVVPTGAVVQIDEKSENVIHSFWVPQLTGKTDVIPGHDNHLWFTADVANTYLGECAEYCGDQHAHMNFEVIAKSPNDFQTWLTQQQQNAQAATSADATAGAKLFTGSGGCTACHGIVGVNLDTFDAQKTNTSSPVSVDTLRGPNLTHFGSRNLIAGGILTNTPQNLATWLKDPQAVKPGNDMAIRQLSPDEIRQLVAYLESLQ